MLILFTQGHKRHLVTSLVRQGFPLEEGSQRSFCLWNSTFFCCQSLFKLIVYPTSSFKPLNSDACHVMLANAFSQRVVVAPIPARFILSDSWWAVVLFVQGHLYQLFRRIHDSEIELFWYFNRVSRVFYLIYLIK